MLLRGQIKLSSILKLLTTLSTNCALSNVSDIFRSTVQRKFQLYRCIPLTEIRSDAEKRALLTETRIHCLPVHLSQSIDMVDPDQTWHTIDTERTLIADENAAIKTIFKITKVRCKLVLSVFIIYYSYRG